MAILFEIVVEHNPVPNEQSINPPIEFVMLLVHIALDLQLIVGSKDSVNPASGILTN